MTLASLPKGGEGAGSGGGGLGPGPAKHPGPSSCFPKSNFGQHRPPRAHWGRLGIRVARSLSSPGAVGVKRD